MRPCDNSTARLFVDHLWTATSQSPAPCGRRRPALLERARLLKVKKTDACACVFTQRIKGQRTTKQHLEGTTGDETKIPQNSSFLLLCSRNDGLTFR